MGMVHHDRCPMCNELKPYYQIVCSKCYAKPAVQLQLSMTIGKQIEAGIREFYSNPRTIKAFR
jgi:hypothetical protein